jgi:hypothetical protein
MNVVLQKKPAREPARIRWMSLATDISASPLRKSVTCGDTYDQVSQSVGAFCTLTRDPVDLTVLSEGYDRPVE